MSADEKASSLQEAGTEPGAQNDLTDPQARNPEASEVASLMEGMEALSTPSITAGEIVQGQVLKITDRSGGGRWAKVRGAGSAQRVPYA